MAARSATQAIAYAKQQQKSGAAVWYQLCLKFTRIAAGIPAVHDSAATAWRNARKRHRTGTPPRGAAVFWDIGKWDHVALSDGNGFVYSNDILRRGRIDRVPIATVTRRWGARYLGWTQDLNGHGLDIDWPARRPHVSLSALQYAATHDKVKAGTEAQIKQVKATLRVLGCGNDATDSFRDMWRRWQRKLGYTGTAADGRPGKASVRKFAARAGYVLVA